MSRPPRGPDGPPLGFDESGALFSDEEREVIAEVARYKQEKHRPFLSVTEILYVLKKMGYRRGDP